jgi:hypothetical protein
MFLNENMNVPLVQPEDGVLPASILPRVGRHCPQLTHLTISGCTLDLQLLQPLTKGTISPSLKVLQIQAQFQRRHFHLWPPESLWWPHFINISSLCQHGTPSAGPLSPAADFVRPRRVTGLAASTIYSCWYGCYW